LTAPGGSGRGAESDARELVIEVSGLRMAYDGFEAVRGVDLQVRRGEIFTFLGPNGRVQFPFLIMLWHNLNREQMTVTFEPAAAGGTRVTIGGAVTRRNHALATDPEHWSETLGASPAQ
jgi:ABC-type branched-subunit amino acid transport system ATPase component